MNSEILNIFVWFLRCFTFYTLHLYFHLVTLPLKYHFYAAIHFLYIFTAFATNLLSQVLLLGFYFNCLRCTVNNLICFLSVTSPSSITGFPISLKTHLNLKMGPIYTLNSQKNSSEFHLDFKSSPKTYLNSFFLKTTLKPQTKP